MMNKLMMWLKSEGKGAKLPPLTLNSLSVDQEIPRYPPFISGLPMCSPERLLETQSELILTIKETLGLNRVEYEKYILPLIENCAAFVHLLPASEAHHHRGAGGLFRHSLEVGAYSAKFAEGKIFAFGKSPQERKEEEPRWVVAAFTAALLHDLGKAATDMAVSDASGSLHWAPYLETLWEWGQANKIDRYFVRWHENRHKNHEQTGLLLANQVLPIDLKAWLAQRNPDIIRTMLEASTCRGDHVLVSIVERADSASVERDLKTNRTLGTEMSVGVPVERHLLDASRRLMGNGTWTVNKKGSRVWVTEEGVFIVWKSAAAEIVQLLSEDRVPGIPRDKDTLADLLLDRDLASKNELEDPEHPKRYWALSPAVLDGRSGPLWLQCLKITDPHLLFNSDLPSNARALLKVAGGEEMMLEGVGEFATTKDATSNTATEAVSTPNDSNDAPKAVKVAKSPEKPEKKPGIRMPGTDTAGAPGKVTPIVETQPSLLDGLDTPEAGEAPKAQSPSPDTPEKSNSPASGQSAGAEAWLKGKGCGASKLLLNILKDIQLGIVEKDAIFGSDQGITYLRYPDAVRPYGKPSEIAQLIDQSGWLVPDPENPMRKARDMHDGKGLVFGIELSEIIVPLLRDGIKPPKLHAVPEQPVKATPSRNQPKSTQPAAVKPSTPTKAVKPSAPKSPKPVPDLLPAVDGRPPAQRRVVKDEVKKIVDGFIKDLRSGVIPARQTKKMSDGNYLYVGLSFISKLSTDTCPQTTIREAMESRPDVVVGVDTLAVKEA